MIQRVYFLVHKKLDSIYQALFVLYLMLYLKVIKYRRKQINKDLPWKEEQMDIRKLEYFEAVSRLGNFTKAAEELHVAQPSISNAIKSLEDELGVKLFARDKRNVALTYEGRIFRPKVVQILELVDNTTKEMIAMSKERNNIINIGIPPVVGGTILPKIFGDFQEKYPEIKIQILELGSNGIIKAIEDNEIDLGFYVLPKKKDDKLETIEVLKGDIKVVLSKNHPLASQDVIDIRDTLNEKIIHVPEHTFVRKNIDGQFKKYNAEPDILVAPEQLLNTISLVEKDLGITFVLGEHEIIRNNNNLIMKSLKEAINFKAGFSWKRDIDITLAMEKFIKYIRDEM